MKRISTDAEYLDSGKIVVDADGIPKDAAIRSSGAGGYGVEISWHTREPWPTSLPGTPA